jgi:lipopolysaccharide exporter
VEKRPFLSDVLRLLTGSVAAQALLVLAAPILTRLFTPDDFAALALFTAASGVLSVVVGGRYEYAVMLPKDDDEARHLLVLALGLSLVGTALMSVPIWVFGARVLIRLGIPSTGDWVTYLPAGILLYSWLDVCNKWQARQKAFGLMAKVQVAGGAAATGAQIGAKLSVPALGGGMLITGQILGRVVSVLLLLRSIGRDLWAHRESLKTSRIWSMARLHWRFPVFSAPSGLVSRAKEQVPAFMLPLLGTEVLGLYSLCVRVLATPLTLVGHSVSHVFFQRIAEVRHDEGQSRALLVKAYVSLLLLIIPPMLVIYLGGEELFSWVFGAEWAVAGRYARLMIPLLSIRFLVSPTALSMQAMERQHLVLVWMLAYLVVIVTVLWTGIAGGNAEDTILWFSLAGTAMYGVWIGMTLQASARSTR